MHALQLPPRTAAITVFLLAVSALSRARASASSFIMPSVTGKATFVAAGSAPRTASLLSTSRSSTPSFLSTGDAFLPRDPSLRSGAAWKRPALGLDYDIYLPTSARTRDSFGDVWGGIGLGIGGIKSIRRTGQFGPDFHVLHRSSGNGYLWLAPVGISYQRSISPNGTFFSPFFGATVDLDFVKLRSDKDAIPSTTRAAAGGSVLVGTNISRTAYVRARYSLVSQVAGFDLSGISFSAGVRF